MLIISLAVLVVVALAGYALYLHLKLRAKKIERQHQQQQLETELAERRKNYRDSIRVICSAILQDQVSLTEASIRISMMATQLRLSEQEKQHYQVFFQLTDATSHIPILEDWKALSKKEQFRLDAEREALEANFRDFIEDTARGLLNGSYTTEGSVLDGDAGGLPAEALPTTKKNSGSKSEPLFYSVGKK